VGGLIVQGVPRSQLVKEESRKHCSRRKGWTGAGRGTSGHLEGATRSSDL